jgi:hypothetical protein
MKEICMAQHIAVSEVDELQKNTIERSDINFAVIQKHLRVQPDYVRIYPWLTTIDEYGNTTFNYLQLPYVVGELKALNAATPSTEIGREIEKLISYLAQKSQGQYILFIGD